MNDKLRITAPKVLDVINEHKILHEKKIDPMIHNHHVILFGNNGDSGLCVASKINEKRIEDLEKTNRKLDNLTWAVISAVVIQLVMAGIRLI